MLIEVKLSPEETKAGLEPESARRQSYWSGCRSGSILRLRGLMTIAPLGVPEAETRACFRSLREWRDRWAAAHPRLELDVLSMGMSGDFALAIEEGATRIRVGTALFGKRAPWTGPPNDGHAARAEGGVTLAVRAQPGAKKTAITGVYGEGAAAQLKIAVHAPPVEGRANAALIGFSGGDVWSGEEQG